MSAMPPDPSLTPLVSFETPDEDRNWRTVNDGVMGGRSEGGLEIINGHLVFSGTINTNGGGFASVRRTLEAGDLKNAEALHLTVKPDERAYRLVARTNVRFEGRYVTYQAEIPPSSPGEWSQVRIAVDDFRPTVFGRSVPAAPFQPAQADELGLIIADGIDGRFALALKSIDIER